MAIKASVKKAWLKALRSGEYEQGTGRLAREVISPSSCDLTTQFCCLGVLGNTQGVPINDLMKYGFLAVGDIKKYGDFGLGKGDGTTGLQDKLAAMNDDGVSFKDIAKYISRNVKTIAQRKRGNAQKRQKRADARLAKACA